MVGLTWTSRIVRPDTVFFEKATPHPFTVTSPATGAPPNRPPHALQGDERVFLSPNLDPGLVVQLIKGAHFIDTITGHPGSSRPSSSAFSEFPTDPTPDRRRRARRTRPTEHERDPEPRPRPRIEHFNFPGLFTLAYNY